MDKLYGFIHVNQKLSIKLLYIESKSVIYIPKPNEGLKYEYLFYLFMC